MSAEAEASVATQVHARMPTDGQQHRYLLGRHRDMFDGRRLPPTQSDIAGIGGKGAIDSSRWGWEGCRR